MKTFINDYTEKCTHPNGYGIIRDYCNNKIYVKKGAYEIIEVE